MPIKIKIDRIGKSIINKQGLKMTIIEYINSLDITVQFEDGTIVKHKGYKNFQNGSINDPNYNIYKDRIGETRTNNQGLKMTIIEYINTKDITVQFEDGTIVEHKRYITFQNGSINNPNYNVYKGRLGKSIINNQGLKMTIIEYINSYDITVQFEDGTILEHRQYGAFQDGGIKNPNYRIGETRSNNQGLLMTVIGYNNANDIDVQFENGTILKRTYKEFQNGSIRHPFPYQLPDTDIILEGVSYVYKDQVNYLYKCNKCNLEDIDTLENINNHKCK